MTLKETGIRRCIFVYETKLHDMLHSVSWGRFISFLVIALSLYYGYLVWKFRLWKRRESRPWKWHWPWVRRSRCIVLVIMSTLVSAMAMAQADGNAGINQANDLVRGYFDTAINLMYAIAGVCGLIGAVEVFIKMHRGQDAGRAVAIWFGGCLFLALVAYVIKSFFGLT